MSGTKKANKAKKRQAAKNDPAVPEQPEPDDDVPNITPQPQPGQPMALIPQELQSALIEHFKEQPWKVGNQFIQALANARMVQRPANQQQQQTG